MAIVFSAKINGDAVNIFSDNNYYSGKSFRSPSAT